MLVPTAEQYRREEHGGRTGHRRRRASGIPGRSDELAALRLTLAATPSQGSTLVLRGEPGVGKSALLDDVARQTREVGWQGVR
jgi:Cdc6-like AAA superfamily ATPase